MEQKYAPLDDPVFDLVPHAFAVRAHAVWMDMGSPEPQFSNAWDIYLHIRDALRSVAGDGAFTQGLSAASQPEHYQEELPLDLRQDEDESLEVDLSDHEGDTLTVDLMDTEEVEEDGNGIGLDV
jgi:hypothetical protein